MRKMQRHVELAEMREHLAYVRKYRIVRFGKLKDFRKEDPAKYRTIGNWAFIDDAISKLSLTYRKASKVYTYIFNKDGSETIDVDITGTDATAILHQYCKVPRCKFPGKKKLSASGLIYADEDSDGIRYDGCVGYDVNSSYSWGMVQPMPDTSKDSLGPGTVGEGEIGLNGDLCLVKKGKTAMYRWPVIESPFKEFVRVWFERKRNAKTPDEKAVAKAVLNMCIGNLQNYNPVLRAFILAYANRRVESYIDDNTLVCNTDSIISKVRRPDIEEDLGTGLGQWKIEHVGSFIHKSTNYQWNLSELRVRGTPRGWFREFEARNGRPWDMAIDPLPAAMNEYEFNPKTLTIRRIGGKANGKKEEQ